MKKLIWPILATVVMAVFTVFQDALSDSNIDNQEWVLVVLGGLMAFNVWATANLPQYTKMKTYVAAVIVVLGALHTFIVGGVSMQEAVNLVILFLGGLGVAFTPQPVTIVESGRTITPDERSRHNV
jgi:predicted MFS family arabinose efflux permease